VSDEILDAFPEFVPHEVPVEGATIRPHEHGHDVCLRASEILRREIMTAEEGAEISDPLPIELVTDECFVDEVVAELGGFVPASFLDRVLHFPHA
jgi:hypothetical protein